MQRTIRKLRRTLLASIDRDLNIRGMTIFRTATVCVETDRNFINPTVIEMGFQKTGYKSRTISTNIKDGVVTSYYLIYNTRRLP